MAQLAYSNPGTLTADPNTASSILGPVGGGAALADQEKMNDYLRNEYAKNQAMEYYRANKEMPSLVSGYDLRNATNQYMNDPTRIEQKFHSDIGPGSHAWQQAEYERQTMGNKVGTSNLDYQARQETQESSIGATNAANREKEGASREAGQMRGYRNFLTKAEQVVDEPLGGGHGGPPPTMQQLQEHVERWGNVVDQAVRAGHITAEEGGNLKIAYTPESKQQMRSLLTALKNRVENWSQANELEKVREMGKESRLTENQKGWWDVKQEEIRQKYALMIKQAGADSKMNPGQMLVHLLQTDPKLSSLTADQKVNFIAEVLTSQANVNALGLNALGTPEERAGVRSQVAPKVPMPQPGAQPAPQAAPQPPGVSMRMEAPVYPGMGEIPPQMMPQGMQGAPAVQAPPMQPPQVDPRNPLGANPMGLPPAQPVAPMEVPAGKGAVQPAPNLQQIQKQMKPWTDKQGVDIISINPDGSLRVRDRKTGRIGKVAR